MYLIYLSTPTSGTKSSPQELELVGTTAAEQLSQLSAGSFGAPDPLLAVAVRILGEGQKGYSRGGSTEGQQHADQRVVKE